MSARDQFDAIAARLLALDPGARQAVLRRMMAQGLNPARLPIFPGERQVATVLASAQARQWFLWQLDPGSTAYHLAGALKLQGTLDVEALRASFAALVQRHESLRTVFRADARGVGEQVVRPHMAIEPALLDVSGEPVQAREEKAREEARRLSQTPFDLGEGPLLRVGLIRLCPDE
ncbi:condensation domain-containing protein, partial [Variovorax sp. DT-64]|uniref:condensation domain-containing protein n=1 Tax=Variovorax sp. DT-64 TaxID=3396160 RepID=UPI003F1D48A1